MPNDEEQTLEFFVSVLFQTVEELDNKVRAFRTAVNSSPNAIEILRKVENYSDPENELRHQTYNELRDRASQSLANRDLAEFGEVVRVLRVKANRFQ
jgi:hypothetical protein